MQLLRCDGYYLLEGYEEINGIELEAGLLRCFQGQGEVLLFGCQWHVINPDNLDNETDENKAIYKELKPYIATESEFFEQDMQNKKFIDERTVEINNRWPFPWEPPFQREAIIWYKPQGNNEIVKAIRINESFTCVVKDEGSSFDKLKFALACVETDEGVALYISASEDSDFEKSIIPEIRKGIPELIVDLL